ncbi:MAG: hypothetical protein KF874_01135 [Rhizobiaceae bacterium]|nr:hypothetical protein [Rhizobiaceae bacterium]
MAAEADTSSHEEQSTRRWAIGKFLPAVLAMLILAVMLPVLLVAAFAAHEVTAWLLRDRGDLLVESVVTPIETATLPVSVQIDAAASMMASGAISSENPGEFGAFVQGLLAASPRAGGIALIETDGALRRWNRLGEEAVAETTGTAFRERLLNEAREGKAGRWSEPVFSHSTGEIIFTYAAPVRRNGGLVGILAAFMLARSLSEELADIGKQFDVTPFLIAQDKYVVAHPSMVSREVLQKAVENEQLPTIASLGDPVLASMWNETGKLELSMPLRDATGHRANVDGTSYTYIYRKLALPGEAEMIAGFYLPTSATQQDRWLSAAVTGVGLLLMALAIYAATWLARGLARPMMDFGAASRAIGEFDFREKGLQHWENSRVEEVADTAAAMRRTSRALTAFERYVPKTLVRQLLSLGNDSSRPVRRDMTVMFLDLQGYTRFAKDRPADEVADYLDTIFGRIGPIIEQCGGTIDKYTGDGLMAFWGAPLPDELHATHAVEAAMRIADELTPYIHDQREKSVEHCRIRIGIHSGEAVVGDLGYGGRMNYTVVGDTVNMAKRTEGAGRVVPLEIAVVVVVTPAVVSKVRLEEAGIERAPLDGGEVLGQLWLLGEAAKVKIMNPAIQDRPVTQG